MTGPDRIFYLSNLSTPRPQQFINYGIDFPTPALVPMEVLLLGSALVSCDSLSETCLSLQFGGGGQQFAL